MKVSELNEAGLDRHLRAIAGMLRESIDNFDGDIEAKKEIVETVVCALDRMDSCDLFSTEGWRHAAGLN